MSDDRNIYRQKLKEYSMKNSINQVNDIEENEKDKENEYVSESIIEKIRYFISFNKKYILIIIVILLFILVILLFIYENKSISKWDKFINYIEEQNNNKIQYVTYDSYFNNYVVMEVIYNSLNNEIEIKCSVNSMIFDKIPELYFRDLLLESNLKETNSYINVNANCVTVLYKEKICESGNCDVDMSSSKIKLNNYNVDVYGLYGHSDGTSPYTYKEFYDNYKRHIAMFRNCFDKILENSNLDITIYDFIK